MPAEQDRARRRRGGWIAIALLAACYLCFLGYSIAVVEDPTGFGGIRDPDGLEGVPLLLSIFASPFVVTAAVLIYVFAIRDRGR